MLWFSPKTQLVEISFPDIVLWSRNFEIWPLWNTWERRNRTKTRRERSLWIRNNFLFFEFCRFSEETNAFLLDLGSDSKSFWFHSIFQEKVLISNWPFSTSIAATMEFLGVLKSWRSDAFVSVKNNFPSFQKIRGWVRKPHACSEIYWTTMLLHGWGWFMRKMALPGLRPHTKPRCTNALTTLKISVPYDYYF